MNFYGHLVVSVDHHGHPSFGLGAMLPDFLSMAGVRGQLNKLGALALDELMREGIEFHHQCDKVFHRLRAFRDIESWALGHFLKQGIRRGPARGLAHVGVELCLDGTLVRDDHYHQVYTSSVAIASTLPDRGTLAEWTEEEFASFIRLANRLHSGGLPGLYADDSRIAEILIRIMKPRSLLRLDETEENTLRGCISEVCERVREVSPQIMKDLRERVL